MTHGSEEPSQDQQQAGLAALVAEFCNDRQRLLDLVLPRKQGASEESRRITVQRHHLAHVARFGYGPDGKTKPVPLLHREVHTDAGITVEYFLTLDHRSRYLAVELSKFGLYAGRHPLMHLDFRGDMLSAPSAHWNVHAERAATTRLITRGHPDSPGELASLHLPVGGARMRPCLEDFLELLGTDFGFDLNDGWRDALSAGREQWRRLQIASLVRDVPEEAARVLRDELEYTVIAPDDATPREGRRRDRCQRSPKVDPLQDSES